MDDYFETLTAEGKIVFSAIADAALALGYRAKRDKTHSPGYTFSHRRVKRRILRFSVNRGKPVIKLRFFAAQEYSEFFHEAIRKTIEEYDFRYTGCYGCGNCDGTEGYQYRYPDGREYFRCGSELIEIEDVSHVPLEELLELLREQHRYYLRSPQMTEGSEKII